MGRPKGKGNTPEEITRLVRDLLIVNTSLTGKELQAHVEKQIKQPKLTLRTYQNIKEELLPGILEEKNRKLDYPWNFGALNNNPILTDSIPHILDMQLWVERWQKVLQNTEMPPDDLWLRSNQKHLEITIRQAIWISRLYILFPYRRDKKEEFNSAMYQLWNWSKAYALDEIFGNLNGEKEFDTSILDKAIRNHWDCRVLAYHFVISPRDKNEIGIIGGSNVGGKFDDTLDVVIENNKRVGNK